MPRRKIVYIFVGLFFALFFNPHFVCAYDNHIAHPNIAALAVKSYNFGNDHDITDKQLQYIMQGAREEDTPVRWLNHFYDPIYNIGFSDFIVTDKIQPYKTAQDWLVSPYTQATYADGDRSWQRGLDDYARGEEESAFIELGHAIHLISDMSVPGHTRNSLHVGDSYESFVKNNWNSIKPKLVYDFTEVNSLEQAFNELAIYSNNNFYSDRTIESEKYNKVKIKEIKKINDTLFYFISDKNTKLFVGNLFDWSENDYFKTLNDPGVQFDYSKNLIPKSISYSAGLIKLFITEAEAKKAEMEYEKMSWWEQIKSFFTNPDLPYYRKAVEGYAMEKTLTPLIENGEIAFEKIVEIKKEIEELAKNNEETKPSEKIIPEVQANEVESDKEQVTSTTEEVEIPTTTTIITITTSTTDNTTTTITIDTPIYYGSGGGSSSNNNHEEQDEEDDDEIPTSTPDIDIFAPELFLELLQMSSTSQIILTFSSTETTSLPVNFEGEINTGTLWSPLFPWTTSTSYIYETNNSGDYEFRVRVIDSVFNTSTWTQIATTVPMMDYVYNYLTGEQAEDLVVLTKEGSPYIIENYYYIPPEKTLRVEAGTVIKSLYVDRNNSGVLVLDGNLEVVGTSEEKVIFTSVYDHSFDNDKLNTLDFEGILDDGNWGGIRSYEGSNIKMNNFEIRYAGETLDLYEGLQIAAFLVYHDKCLDLKDSNIEIENGKLEHCGEYAASFSGITGFFKNTEIFSLANGLDIYEGNLQLENLKFSGFMDVPLTVKGTDITMNNLTFENNRLNGFLDENLSTDIVLTRTDIPYILDDSNLYYASSITASPGVKVYINYDDYFSAPINFVGTAENPIEIYLSNVYWNALRLDGVNADFQNVNFVNSAPFLDSISAKSLGINTVAELMGIDYVRADFFGNDSWRALGLVMKNGTLNMENVNFVNNETPWLSSLNVTNNTTTLKNVNFYNNKSNGDLSYLSETGARGIEVNGGTLSMDNVNFSDLVTGVFYAPVYDCTGCEETETCESCLLTPIYAIPTITTNNMSVGNFVNVTNVSSPEDLVVFPE